jgi:hypothetical protein
MGGAVKSVSKAASKAVGGATKAVGNIVKETAKAPGVVAGLLGGKKKAPGEAGYNAAIDGATDDSAGPAQPFGGLANQLGVERPPQAAINPFAAPKRAGFVLPKFNQMQARTESGQPIPGQPQQPIPGQPPQLNQGGMNRFRNNRQQPQAPQAPMAPAPGTAPAPVAPMAPAPGLAPAQPTAINPIAAPVAPPAPEVKPPAPAQAAPVQQQQAPGTPAPGAAPAAGASESAATISPEDQFKKTQASMYQVNK